MNWENIDPAKWADALLYLIVGLLGAFGLGQARKKKPQPQGDVLEVAGAIVSDKAVDRMVKSLDEFSAAATVLKAAIDRDVEAKGALTAAMIENSRALWRNSDVSEDMHQQIKDAENKMDRLREEMLLARASHGGGMR